jgi:hypothetical protein
MASGGRDFRIKQRETTMSLEDITPEETGRIAGILETKWARMVNDTNKLREELEAARVAAEILQKDAGYWHDRALVAEARGDKHWADMDFMLQQWNKLRAQCIEVDRMIKRGILAPQTDTLASSDDPIPRVVVFNRGVDARNQQAER